MQEERFKVTKYEDNPNWDRIDIKQRWSEWTIDGTEIVYTNLTTSIRKRNVSTGSESTIVPVVSGVYTLPLSLKNVVRNNLSTRKAKYVFSGDGNDLYNKFNGTAMGSCSTSGGICTLPDDNTSYFKAPAGLINLATAVTITARIRISTLHTGSGEQNTFLTAPCYSRPDEFMLFYDAFNNRWTWKHSNTTSVNFSNSDIEDGTDHFIAFQVLYGTGSYSKLFLDDMSTPIATNANTHTMLDSNMLLFGQDVDSFGTIGVDGQYPPQGFASNQSLAGRILYLNIETKILSEAELNALKSEAGL
jgi:hypothetical protein